MDTKAKAAEILAKATALKEKLKSAKLGDVISALPEIITYAEKEALEMSGEDKKAVVVEILNALIDVPFVPESVEGWVISFTIDKFVAGFNKLFGKDWVEKLV